MNYLIRAFIAARKEFTTSVDAFPEAQREAILFGNWSLKQILIHIIFWDTCIADNVALLKTGKEPPFYGKVNDYNQQSIEKGKSWSWEKTYQEFKLSGERVIREYETLPKEKWEAKFWKNKNSTPKKFLNILIEHYLHEHLPEIKKVMESLK